MPNESVELRGPRFFTLDLPNTDATSALVATSDDFPTPTNTQSNPPKPIPLICLYPPEAEDGGPSTPTPETAVPKISEDHKEVPKQSISPTTPVENQENGQPNISEGDQEVHNKSVSPTTSVESEENGQPLDEYTVNSPFGDGPKTVFFQNQSSSGVKGLGLLEFVESASVTSITVAPNMEEEEEALASPLQESKKTDEQHQLRENFQEHFGPDCQVEHNQSGIHVEEINAKRLSRIDLNGQ